MLEREKLRRLVHVPGNTLDGVMVELHANIELPEEAQHAREVGADGIGLFRSEFLFLNRRDLPTEDEQYEAYRAAVLAMRGKPVTIRTLDVGADKALDEPQAAVSPNPALATFITYHFITSKSNPRGRVYIAMLNRGITEMRESGEWYDIVATGLAEYNKLSQ